jgi:hypothetical protein
MDLYSFISHAELGAPTGEGSSTWGWTDPLSGREFIGMSICSIELTRMSLISHSTRRI